MGSGRGSAVYVRGGEGQREEEVHRGVYSVCYKAFSQPPTSGGGMRMVSILGDVAWLTSPLPKPAAHPVALSFFAIGRTAGGSANAASAQLRTKLRTPRNQRPWSAVAKRESEGARVTCIEELRVVATRWNGRECDRAMAIH